MTNNLDLTKFKILRDHLIVKALKEKGVKGLDKPDNIDEKPEFGEVVSVSDTAGETVKVGDTIYFSKYSSEKTRNAGEDYYIIRIEDVIGKK